MKRYLRLITTILSVSLLGASLIGCKKEAADSTAKSNSATGEVAYPIKTDVSLTYWLPLDTKVSAHSKTLNDTEFAKALEKQTGIKVIYQHPAQGQEKEAFNIMIASKELPDIIQNNWISGYAGGPEKAMQDEIIIKVNDLIDKYAPNYKKYISGDKALEKEVKTDTGSHYGFANFKGDDFATVNYGPLFRADWLKELGLPAPTTIDEFEAILKAFKDKKGIASPFTQGKNLNGEFIAGAYGININWFIDDNKKAAYGPMTPQYKEYLTVLNRWYANGLLDKNFVSNDGNAVKANMLNGKSGATLGLLGGDMSTWLSAMKDKEPKYDLVGVPYPVLKKGDKVKFAQKDWMYTGLTVAITTSCKNPDIATRLLDYAYSKEGDMLYNFGIEGVSYNMVNGTPTFTDEVMKNPKLSVQEAMAKYIRGNIGGPMIQRGERVKQTLTFPQQMDAITTWAKADPYPNKYPNATISPDESAELASIESDINTLVSETTMKIIMGVAPLSEVEKLQGQIKNMKFDRAVQIRQNSIDRYNKR